MYDFLGYLTLATIPAFLLLDLVHRHRRVDTPRFWKLRAAVVTAGIFFFTGWVAGLWAQLFDGFSLLDLSALGAVGGAVVGVVVYEFFHYWYHRAAHAWNWLWFAGHQMHHSAEDVDAFGALYLHPFDAAMFTSISSLVFFPLLGVTAEAGVIGALFLTFNATFQHANIKTPQWLGYLIQRPEMHAVHHGRFIHRFNYADLPLWDMVFDTFINPKSTAKLVAGFYPGASARLGELLVGRDVSKPAGADAEPVLSVSKA